VPEEDDGPEDEEERGGRGAETEDRAEGAADPGADGSGDVRYGRWQDRERQERAREEGQDGPELILPARVDGR